MERRSGTEDGEGGDASGDAGLPHRRPGLGLQAHAAAVEAWRAVDALRPSMPTSAPGTCICTRAPSPRWRGAATRTGPHGAARKLWRMTMKTATTTHDGNDLLRGP